MPDTVSDFARSRGLGRLERRVALRLPAEARQDGMAAELVRTTDGLWVVLAADTERGEIVDLLRGPLAYHRGKKGDTLEAGGRSLEIPGSRRDDARALIARGRLELGAPPTAATLTNARHVEAPSDTERAALRRTLLDGEVLIAFLRTTTTEPLPSPIESEATGRVHLVLTDRAARSMILSDLGDLQSRELAGELRVDRDAVTAGDHRLIPKKNAAAFAEIAPLVAMGREDRLLEAARLNWLSRKRTDCLKAARLFLHRLAGENHPLGVVAEHLVSLELSEPETALSPLSGAVAASAPDSAEHIVALFDDFGASLDTGQALVARLRAAGGDRLALPLHAAVNGAISSAAPEALRAALSDLDLGAHAISVEEPERARRVLEARLERLPEVAVEDVALGVPVSAEIGTWLWVRIRLLELLADARKTGGRRDARALAAVARLQPLARARLDDLIAVADDPLLGRARQARRVIEPGGLDPEREGPGERAAPGTARRRVPLRRDLLEVDLRGREAGSKDLLAWLQTMVAASGEPDLQAVRSYCEALDPRSGEPAVVALEEARTVLGVGPVEAFISRGRKDVGIRAYLAERPFLIIGARHLQAGHAARMSTDELRFAFGAELAHVRFRHTRVTVDAVFEGALEKSRQGLDVVLGVLPIVKSFAAAGRFSRIVPQLDASAVSRALRSASALNDAIGRALGPPRRPSGESDLAPSNEKLIAAHRLMQLTADRSGLVLAGSPRAAIRAMMLVRRDYHQALSATTDTELERVLRAELESERPELFDLAVRIAATVAFYLGDDYERLREASFS